MHRTSFVVAVLLAAPALAQDVTYKGMCEASAGVSLDDGRFVAASDETRNMRPEPYLLHVYVRGETEPAGTFKLPIEADDIEAATRVGDTAYWLTSHSWNSDNEPRPRREHLFAVAIGPSGLSQLEWDLVGLRNTIAPAIEAAAGIAVADLPARLNIEGLAAAADDHLLVGLREPLASAASQTERRAIVIDIDAPSDIGEEQPGEIQAAAVHLLDLGGRGVRSIERVGDRFLIVAGDVHASDDEHRVDFGEYGTPGPALYWWDGPGTEVAPAVLQADLNSFGASLEGLIAWSDNEVMILGDNGDGCSDEDDPVEERSFPTVTIAY